MFSIKPQQANDFGEDSAAPISCLKISIPDGLAIEAPSIAQATASIAQYVPTTQGVSSSIVETVCTHLGLEIKTLSTRVILPENFYLQGGGKLDKFLRETGYEVASGGTYVKRRNNMPVVLFSLESNPVTNFSIYAMGEASEIDKIEDLVCTLVRPINETDLAPKQSCIELVDFDYRDQAVWQTSEVYRETVIKPEYYPFLIGGVENLMREFLASEENCMVWYGEPGTGKTSAIRAMMISLGILPVIAMKPSLFSHKHFLRDIFAYSDSTMRQNVMAERLGKAFSEKDRPDSLKTDKISAYIYKKWGVNRESRFESRVPVIVIEDADLLMAPRGKGNSLMNQLLNEVDGIGSSSSRKIIFTTNQTSTSEIDEALIRDGRSFGEFYFRKLTPDEAIAARAAAGLPPFEKPPIKDTSLATALQKPRQRFTIDGGGRVLGFVK